MENQSERTGASAAATPERDSKRQWIMLGLALLAFIGAGIAIDAVDHVFNPENTSRVIEVPTPVPPPPPT